MILGGADEADDQGDRPASARNAVHGFMTASPGPAGIPLANGPLRRSGAELVTAAGDCVPSNRIFLSAERSLAADKQERTGEQTFQCLSFHILMNSFNFRSDALLAYGSRATQRSDNCHWFSNRQRRGFRAGSRA